MQCHTLKNFIKTQNTVLVFGINLLCLHIKLFVMSEELTDFSEKIDEQFEIADIEIETDEFWEAIVNLFI